MTTRALRPFLRDLARLKGRERYEKRMNRQRAVAESSAKRPIPLPPNPRLVYDMKRLREKRAAEIARDLDEQGKRTRQTSLPIEQPSAPALSESKP